MRNLRRGPCWKIRTELTPAKIVKKALEIAGDLCIYSNQNHLVEVLE